MGILDAMSVQKNVKEKGVGNRMRMLLSGAAFLFCFEIFFPGFGHCSDLAVLSLDELLDLKVVSVAKVPEKVTDTPAAITIITGEDLRRNGVQSIPEALRMVPGMHVYQIDANKWAVSARGFSSRFANKMLVMIDGRTVYSTLFSGVFWDVQDLMIEDIDRIEVIRGPGGTLWGANAVNGVINIISKDSADTQGGLVALRVETGPDGEVSTRYGGWLNDKISYRVYGKYFDRDNFDTPGGSDAADDWHQARGGFRMDMNVSATNKLTLQGDIYDGKSGESVKYVTPSFPFLNVASTDAPVSGGNVLGRWTRTFLNRSEVTLQAYYDHIERNEFFIDETLDTADLDFQHRLNVISGVEILYGLGYRYTRSNTAGKETIPGIYSYAMNPRISENDLFSGFFQGRLKFADEKGELTLGTKLEHNDFTGFEWQPSARILWSVNTNHSLWAAISRSVRTPSRIEHDADVNIGLMVPPRNGLMTFVRLMGNDNVDSEQVYSYEAGYRGRMSENLFMDLTIYYNKYYDLIAGVPTGTLFPEVSSSGGRLVFPVLVANSRDAETYGAELSCSWSVADWWRLTGGYTWFHLTTLDIGSSLDARQGFNEDENANQFFSLVSYMDLPHNCEVNTALYVVGALDGLDIDAHTRFDLNLSWHPTEKMTLAAGVNNLLDDSHQEFNDTMDGIMASEIPRVLYTKLTITF
jgi:iron complex outermembrane receptor protein